MHWADSELAAWLHRKQKSVEAARNELDAAAAESHPQRILAGALVGLLYEDVSRTLLTVPVPQELASDPEILTIYREVRQAQASPFLEHARRAYQACAQNAQPHETFTRWERYCESRAGHLPDTQRSAATVPNGTTEVTVLAEP